MRAASEVRQEAAAKELKRKLNRERKRYKELDGLFKKLYESYAVGKLTEKQFDMGFALLLPKFFGLNGVLYSMPVSDLLTFVICGAVIAYTCRTLDTGIRRYGQLSKPERGLSQLL